MTWLEGKLDQGQFQGQARSFSGMTLSQFHAATRRDLSLVTSNNTTGERMLVLNHNTAPDLPVVWAVRWGC